MRAIQRYVPSLRWEHVQSVRPYPWLMPWLERPVLRSGVRAQALRSEGTLEEDFVIEVQQRLGERGGSIEEARDVPAAIMHLRNAPSPAATSSLTIARRVVDRAEQAFHL